ncbi:MAG: hypothetical protein PHY93_03805 [Bacteriovorax sp.]|nr:hypothetical protein [Bacteriovorax sp.]
MSGISNTPEGRAQNRSADIFIQGLEHFILPDIAGPIAILFW